MPIATPNACRTANDFSRTKTASSLKRLNRGIEEGIVELDGLRERVVELKAERENAQAYDRAIVRGLAPEWRAIQNKTSNYYVIAVTI